MKYKAAVVIQASAGLALVSVSRQLSFFLCSFDHSIDFVLSWVCNEGEKKMLTIKRKI
jgi:hypothetical protein